MGQVQPSPSADMTKLSLMDTMRAVCCAVLLRWVLRWVLGCRLLTAESSDRTVIHVELSLSDSGMRFAAGDAVGVLPANDPALVAAVLARLGVDGDDVFEVQPASEDGEAGL